MGCQNTQSRVGYIYVCSIYTHKKSATSWRSVGLKMVWYFLHSLGCMSLDRSSAISSQTVCVCLLVEYYEVFQK